MAVKAAVIKYGGTTIGIGAGNAFAYFGLQYLTQVHGMVFDDPAVAVAMGGTVVAIVFMEFGKLGRALKYMFDRMFPVPYDHDHEDHHKDD